MGVAELLQLSPDSVLSKPVSTLTFFLTYYSEEQMIGNSEFLTLTKGAAQCGTSLWSTRIARQHSLWWEQNAAPTGKAEVDLA